MINTELIAFIKESNRIEGILRPPTQDEINAHHILLVSNKITVDDMCGFVNIIQPGAVLRDKEGLNVRVGNHIPPFGSPEIHAKLDALLAEASRLHALPKVGLRNHGKEAYGMHREYESLHPFTDGNGRSGRALWLWLMMGRAPLGFLHTWYYQSLDSAR